MKYYREVLQHIDSIRQIETKIMVDGDRTKKQNLRLRKLLLTIRKISAEARRELVALDKPMYHTVLKQGALFETDELIGEEQCKS